MTTFKRIMAVIMAVMLIASVGVIAASASASDPELTFDATGADAKGFKFDVYQIATLNTVTGEYTCVNDDVKAIVNTPNQSGADFLAAVKALTNLGSPIKNDLKESTYTTKTAGIYYVKVDGNPVIDNQTVTPTKKLDSIIVWPEAVGGTYTKADATVNLSDKVSSSPINVTKAFAVNDEESKSLGQSEGTNTVDFLLSASVAGSAEKPASEYYIWDKMSKGLTYNKGTVKVYSNATLTNEITAQFTISDGSPISEAGEYNGGTYFTVTPKDLTADSAFYTYETIYVKYTATLNADAVVAPQANPNKDGVHAIVDGENIDKDGNVRKVYTYNLKIKKVDGETGAPLKDAEFDLKLNGTTIAHGKSDANGIVEFLVNNKPIKLAPSGTGVAYTVVETAAAPNYAKNTDSIPVTVNDTKGNTAEYDQLAAAIEVPNYPTKLPLTGGAGTLWFTIGGIALIVAAGVMFVVIMRKKSASK